MEHVILVDNNDNELGTMEKIAAHEKGKLHRAFSILLFNSKGQLLLQKRAACKYHSAGLWTNTCCSHPLPGESLQQATQRKLMQELGIDRNPSFAYKFIYKVKLNNYLIEHECDHVFIGQFNGEPIANTEEVEDWKYMDMASIRSDVKKNPSQYTAWFKLIIDHPEIVSLKT
jgi:isopentenyl-diphosphate Delta-isomerase